MNERTSKRLATMVCSSLLVTILGMLPDIARCQPAVVTARTNPSGYTIIDRGPNSRTWASTTTETTPFGDTRTHTNLIYELATGMHYRDTNGVWQESQELFTVLQDRSGAVALRGPYQVFVPADIYEGVISVTLPSGEVIHTRPVSISYFDGTNNVLIAELTNSTAQLSADGRQVIWPSAFTDLQADLVATYSRGSFEFDLIFREQPPDPATLGLAENCRLQLLTETFDSPTPTSDVQIASATDLTSGTLGQPGGTNVDASAQFTDARTLRFHGMSMPPGKAFFIGYPDNGTNSFHVRKSWFHYQNRTFLLEDLPYPMIRPALSTLHASTYTPSGSKLLAQGRLPSRGPPVSLPRPPTNSKAKIKLALARPRNDSGLVFDYQLQGSVTNFTLQSDNQYFVTGPFYVSGVLTIEGGSITQFSNTSSAKISFSGPMACRTDRYKPAVFSCQNDWTVGAAVPGASGNPAPIAATYLEDTSDADNAYRHMRFSYANRAVSITTGYTGNDFWHCQFLCCSNAVVGTAYRTVNLYNVLVSSCGTVLNTCYYFNAQHVTCDQSGTFGSSITSPTSSGLTNCILTGLTNLNNSFPLCSCQQASSGAGIYQASGAGSYYLATGSGCQGAGTTNIHPALLLDLKQLTTWPPLVSYNTTNYSDQTILFSLRISWAQPRTIAANTSASSCRLATHRPPSGRTSLCRRRGRPPSLGISS